MNNEDAELLRRYVEEGSEAAFAELVQRYIDLVYHAALRQLDGDVHRAKDVTQIVFSLLARKARSLRQHRTLAGWLHLSTRFASQRAKRTEWRRQRREQEAWHLSDAAMDTSNQTRWEQLRPVIDEALGCLHASDREAVLLRFFANLSFAEVGARLDLSENAARMRVDRALEKLHAVLARREVTSTGAALATVLASQAGLAAPAGLSASVTSVALAGGGAVAATGWLSFMSTMKVTALVAGGVAFLAVGTAVHEMRAARLADEAVATAQRERALLREQVAEAERRVLTASEENARRRALDAVRPPEPPAPANLRPGLAAGRAFLAANPAIKEMLVDSKRAGVAGRYFPLYRKLGLSETQVEQFELIMMSGITDSISLIGHGVILLEPAPALEAEDKKRRLREVLGEAGYRQFDEYQNSLATYVSRLGSALYFTETPLTADQGWKLAQVFAEQNRKTSPGRMTAQAYWDAIAGQAKTFLTEPQMQAMDILRRKDEYMWAEDQAKQLLATAKNPGN